MQRPTFVDPVTNRLTYIDPDPAATAREEEEREERRRAFDREHKEFLSRLSRKPHTNQNPPQLLGPEVLNQNEPRAP